MIWGKTREQKDARIAAWEKWHETFLWVPRKLEDTHEWAWLTHVWIRWEWEHSYTDGGFWTAHRAKTLPPLHPAPADKGVKLVATCIVCKEEEDWPMCTGCRKAILAFKAVCD